MIEVIFGIFIGIGFAIFCPGSFSKLKEKVLKLLGKCDHENEERPVERPLERPLRKSKYD